MSPSASKGVGGCDIQASVHIVYEPGISGQLSFKLWLGALQFHFAEGAWVKKPQVFLWTWIGGSLPFPIAYRPPISYSQTDRLSFQVQVQVREAGHGYKNALLDR